MTFYKPLITTGDGQVRQIDDEGGDELTYRSIPTHGFFNGTFRESFDATVNSPDSVNIVMTLNSQTGNTLTAQFSDGHYTLNMPMTLNLTPGTDAVPNGVMVFIDQATKTLQSSSDWPSAEHVKVAYFALPSANFVATYGGPYVNQNWNDHLTDTTNLGHLAHVCRKVRLGVGATWRSGIDPQGSTNSYFTYNTGNVYWQSSAGVIEQMHPQTFEAKDTSNTNVILVENHPTTNYAVVDNLYTGITVDSTGNTILNNKYFNLVFWGVQNKSAQGSGVVVNLPSGTYATAADAEADVSSYDSYDPNRVFNIDSGTAFLICRATFQKTATGWDWISTTDLRGRSNFRTGGGGGGTGVTDHGALTGLTDDDHTQYVLADGTRAITTNNSVGVVMIDTGNNNISANGAASVIISGQNNTLDGTNAGMFAGNYSTISGNALNAVIVGGYLHTLNSGNGVIAGGRSHVVSGLYGAAVGGYSSMAMGESSAVVGGQDNDVYGDIAVALGGYNNDVNGTCSAAVAAYSSTTGNTANASAIIASNLCSTANTTTNTLIAATNNAAIIAGSTDSAIIGGKQATLNGVSCVIIGGQSNNISNAQLESAIVGGNDVVMTGSATDKAFAGAGYNIDFNGYCAGSIGGRDNSMQGDYSFIAGGRTNSLVGARSVILGGGICTIASGYINGIYSSYNSTIQSTNVDTSVIVGGHTSIIVSESGYSALVGGYTNTVNGDAAGVFTGCNNDAVGSYATCVGGKDNTANGTRATVVGGGTVNVNGYSSGAFSTFGAEVGSDYSAILGGRTGNIQSASGNAAIVGGQGATLNSGDSAMIAGYYNTIYSGSYQSALIGGQNQAISANSYASCIAGGQFNTVNNYTSGIFAGQYNTVNGHHSVILGGKYNESNNDFQVMHGNFGVNDHYGCYVHTSSRQSFSGDTEYIRAVVTGTNSANASEDLTLDGVASANSTNKLVMPADCVWEIYGVVSAMNLAGSNGCAYNFRCAIVRYGTAAPAFMGLGTAGTNPLYNLHFEDNTSYNIAVNLRTGNVVAIGVFFSGTARWTAVLNIAQTRT